MRMLPRTGLVKAEYIKPAFASRLGGRQAKWVWINSEAFHYIRPEPTEIHRRKYRTPLKCNSRRKQFSARQK